MDWFLYDNGLRHERVNPLSLCLFAYFLNKLEYLISVNVAFDFTIRDLFEGGAYF